MKVLFLLFALCAIVALAQDDAPYPSWMRAQDDDLRRRQAEIDRMPDSPLKETRMFGLENDREAARQRAAVYESQRQDNALRREAERARSLESARRAEADLPRQRVRQEVQQRQQEAADAAAMRDASQRYQSLNWQGPYTQQQRSFDDQLRRDREAAYAMPPSPLRDTRLFGVQQREEQQRGMYGDSVRRAERELRSAQQACGSGRSLQASNGASCDFRKVQQLQQRVRQAKQEALSQRRRRGGGGGRGRGRGAGAGRGRRGAGDALSSRSRRGARGVGSRRRSSSSASSYRRPYGGNRRIFNYRNGRRMYAVINPRNGRIRDMQNIGRASRMDQRRQRLRRSDRPSRR